MEDFLADELEFAASCPFESFNLRGDDLDNCVPGSFLSFGGLIVSLPFKQLFFLSAIASLASFVLRGEDLTGDLDRESSMALLRGLAFLGDSLGGDERTCFDFVVLFCSSSTIDVSSTRSSSRSSPNNVSTSLALNERLFFGFSTRLMGSVPKSEAASISLPRGDFSSVALFFNFFRLGLTTVELLAAGSSSSSLDMTSALALRFVGCATAALGD